jgi:hypothetical protein
MAMNPPAKPIKAYPAAPSVAAAASAICTSPWRSINLVASGTAMMRTSIGVASTMPISRASRPRACSQAGK